MCIRRIETVRCRNCGETKTLEIPKTGWESWKAGELIQNAMPQLSCADRELLISGTCGKCWDEMYGSLEEDEDIVLRDQEPF